VNTIHVRHQQWLGHSWCCFNPWTWRIKRRAFRCKWQSSLACAAWWLCLRPSKHCKSTFRSSVKRTRLSRKRTESCLQRSPNANERSMRNLLKNLLPMRRQLSSMLASMAWWWRCFLPRILSISFYHHLWLLSTAPINTRLHLRKNWHSWMSCTTAFQSGCTSSWRALISLSWWVVFFAGLMPHSFMLCRYLKVS